MGRDISNTKLQDRAFEILGDAKSVNIHTLSKLFAIFRNSDKPAFYTDDIIMIGPGHSPYVQDKSYTTLGIYIANKFLYEDLEIFGYINKILNKKTIGKIDVNIAEAIKSGDLSTDKVFNFIDRCQYLFGGGLAHLINTSISSTIITLPKSTKMLREKRFAENRAALDANDPQTAARIEQELTKDALDQMRKVNDPAMAVYDSGCGVDPYNNYKTMFVMKGAVADNTGESPTGYKVVTSNYNDGVSKEDMPKIADTVVTSGYSSGVLTQNSGYSGKMYNMIFQRSKLGPRGSDCGATATKKVLITDVNKGDYGQYRFIMEGGKPVMLTPDTVDKYVGKIVYMRSPKYCKFKDPEYCNICFGDREYRIGVKNIGLTFNIAAGAALNAALKKKHDITIKMHQITVDDLTKFIGHAR